MIERKDCEGFEGHVIAIGVRHYNIPDRPFFLSGFLVELTDDFLKLKTKDGIKLIAFDEILEIRLAKTEVMK